MSRREYSQFKPTDLSKAIHETILSYTNEVQGEIDKEAKKISSEAAKKLEHATSFEDRRGSYRYGWRVKKVQDGYRWHSLSYVVHNATDYQLTHLLENGHALKRGERVVGHAPPKVHIAPVEQEAVEDFIKAVEKAVKR